MCAIASQITSLMIIYSIVYSDADQRKHQSSASLAFVQGIHRGPVNSPHEWPVTRKMFPFDDFIMYQGLVTTYGGNISLFIIDLCNGLSLIQHQAIARTSNDILSIRNKLQWNMNTNAKDFSKEKVALQNGGYFVCGGFQKTYSNS